MIQNDSNKTKGAGTVGKHLHSCIDEFAMRHNHRRPGTEHHLNNGTRAMAGKEPARKKLAN